ncbi:hypothetical protein HAX54_027265 [Datura stramonium]|uniref:Uncharacterized protein n=1 Tax=Datura stramonium TaxID=4076 RepID=A0ABS8V3Q1_DATST|nr:hypothetical protein [Datura stramonium]
MALSGMRGLSVFISDIRNCQNKEQERLRVDKERQYVCDGFAFRVIAILQYLGLTPYEKKKYVWKMLYIYMLGYDVDFGHMEAVSLISAPKYPEKQRFALVNLPTYMLVNTEEVHVLVSYAAAYVLCKYRARLKGWKYWWKEFAESLAPDVQKLLVEKVVFVNQDIPQEYTYYGIPSPWLQVKTMRPSYFLTIEDPSTRRSHVLQRILMGTGCGENVNKNNASHAVLFEALALCVALLGKFIVSSQIFVILACIRRRALDLLYGMCDVSNAKDIVEELLQLTMCRIQYSRVRGCYEELSLKIAILAEKFAPDLSWYVGCHLTLTRLAILPHDIVPVVQFVTKNEDLRQL